MPEPGEIVYNADGSVTIGAPVAKASPKKEN